MLILIISIFYIISLTTFGIRITRHRNAGGQSTQLPYDAVAQTGAEQEKAQPQAQAYPVSEEAVPASTVQTQQQLYGGYYQPQAQPQPQTHPTQ